MDGDKPTVELNEDVILASHKFAVNLYKVLAEEKSGNLFFSPISIQLALLLACVGAKGKTEEEILSSLQLSKDKSKWMNDAKVLVELLTKSESLKVATEIFIEQCYKVKKDYIEEAKTYLQSMSQLLDFASGSEAAESSRHHINNWVLKHTNNKINELLPLGTITADTRLVLVNAIHFKNAWEHEFKSKNTKEKPFHLTKTNSVPVPMMNISQHFRYADKGAYQALEMPYKGYEFRMLILLPKEIDGLSTLEDLLPSINLIELSRELSSQNKIDVYFPKFKLEQFFDLNNVLKKLGVQSMFDASSADFSGMYEENEAPLCVSKVVHKSFLDVNEEGTEAAAATGMMMMMCCSAVYPVLEPILFNADHPFIFCITHSDVLLFISKITAVKKV